MSRQRDVRLALKALVTSALPAARVTGFDVDAVRPARASAGGDVMGFPGDPEETGVDLSPLTYFYDHRFPIEIGAPAGGGDADEAIDAMMQSIGAAVQADRTLGGLCEWLDVSAAEVNDRAVEGAEALRWGQFDIIASYSTTNPLA